MELAKIGLGLKELSFDIDGDAIHTCTVVFLVFYAAQLDKCGGYTLLCLSTNSTDLLEIQPPTGDCVVSQRYRQSARLSVRRLEANINCEDESHAVGLFYVIDYAVHSYHQWLIDPYWEVTI